MENFEIIDQTYSNIPKSEFEFANKDKNIHDEQFDTKPIGYFKDAMSRFKKNKSSVVATFIILFLILYAILVPMCFKNNYNTSLGDNTFLQYPKLLPKAEIFEWLGWDGCKTMNFNTQDMVKMQAIGVETGMNPVKSYEKVETSDGISYDCCVDSYANLGMLSLSLTKEEYDSIQRWQDENNVQVIFPSCNYKLLPTVQQASASTKPNLWYYINEKGKVEYTIDENGNFVFQNIYAFQDGKDNYTSLRIEGDSDTQYQYAVISGTAEYGEDGKLVFDEDGYIKGTISYGVRVSKYNYFQYKYGFEPSFVFGTNGVGQDIFYRLANGARFSFVLAIFVSAINLTIGALYGAIEGYYGGVADMVMERIVEILGGIPFIVVTTLFQLHLAKYVGVVGALLFAFVTTGWVGMAGTVRMQFYRFKNQEYILAARTLGAKDGRIMFKHIFPNAIGTIITGCVLVIPGVIFTESSLTYLGIINLESSQWTSVGTMLALGKDYLQNFPHIILFPALFISLLEISFNLFGNGLRDAFNPSLRGSED